MDVTRDHTATWALFDEVARSVGRRVRALDAGARGAAGERAGQYGLDLLADDLVIGPLVDAGFGVLSEESGHHHPERPVCVVVDPVDGSTNASRGLPSWATSMCAVDDQGPWVATVVDHTRDVTYRARRGGGATKAEGGGPPVAVAVASPVDPGDAVVAVNGWAEPLPPARQLRMLGAAAIEICLVAEGALDAYVNLDGDSHGAWDYLGALLVLTEAGGVAADRRGRDLVVVDHDARRQVVVGSSEDLLTAMMR